MRDGLVCTAEHGPNLRAIITDLHLPGMDGIQFARAVRRMLPGGQGDKRLTHLRARPLTTERQAMGSLKADVRHAVRALVKAPVFTAVTVITLALGIGANSAMFSLVNAVLLRPLGYAEPERLMLIYEGFRGSAEN